MQSLPLTVRRSIELIGLVVLGMVIVTGQQIIMPLVMAFFMSLVLLPVYRFLYRKKMPKVLCIFLSRKKGGNLSGYGGRDRRAAA